MKRAVFLCGGQSSEHEVSMRSVQNVLVALDRDTFIPYIIYIDKRGGWFYISEDDLNNYPQKKIPDITDHLIKIVPGGRQGGLMAQGDDGLIGEIDVVFPVLHGTNCEDGTLQGLLEQIGIPYVGCDVTSSANCFDKEITKNILRLNSVPVVESITLNKAYQKDLSYETIAEQLGETFFVKPARQGSSVGVHKVHNAKAYKKALKDAFVYDSKLLCEKFIKGVEIEVSILGNRPNIRVSIPGKIIPQAEFYSYEAKYLDDDGAILEIPAQITEDQVRQVQEYALRAYSALGCDGLARVDFFLTDEGQFLLNELNTLPGFTSISMYPKLWEASGVEYTDLITELLELGMRKFRDKK